MKEDTSNKRAPLSRKFPQDHSSLLELEHCEGHLAFMAHEKDLQRVVRLE